MSQSHPPLCPLPSLITVTMPPAMHHFQGEQGQRKSIAPLRKLWTALHALHGYLTGQSDWLVNYAKRHRAGLRVGTAITEGTANFLVTAE